MWCNFPSAIDALTKNKAKIPALEDPVPRVCDAIATRRARRGCKGEEEDISLKMAKGGGEGEAVRSTKGQCESANPECRKRIYHFVGHWIQIQNVPFEVDCIIPSLLSDRPYTENGYTVYIA